MTLNVSVNTGNIIGNMVGSMLATSLTKEIIVARNCNMYTISDIPAGKYSPTFGLDQEQKAQPAEFSQVLKNSY